MTTPTIQTLYTLGDLLREADAAFDAEVATPQPDDPKAQVDRSLRIAVLRLKRDRVWRQYDELLRTLAAMAVDPPAEKPTDGRPFADFVVTRTSGPAPLEVEFANLSKDAAKFEWEFGDGTTFAGAKDPKKTYPLPGEYEVRLMARNPKGETVRVRRITVG